MSSVSEERRQKIAAAATQLFQERGFTAVSAEDIAERAGIGVRTFYRYFPTKESVAFVDHEAMTMRYQAALQARSGTAGVVDILVDVSRPFMQQLFSNPEFYRTRYQMIETEPALRDRQRLVDIGYMNVIAEFVAQELPDLPNVEIAAATVAATWVFAYTAANACWAQDETADPAVLLAAAEATMRRVVRAIIATGDPTAGPDSPDHDPDLVLVLSDDPDLREEVRSVVDRHRDRSP